MHNWPIHCDKLLTFFIIVFDLFIVGLIIHCDSIFIYLYCDNKAGSNLSNFLIK